MNAALNPRIVAEIVKRQSHHRLLNLCDDSGFEAADDGKCASINPFPAGTDQHNAWKGGYIRGARFRERRLMAVVS